MNNHEELHAKLFNHEKSLVKDMDDLQLRAHREELSLIAFEARARLTAVDDEGKERDKKRKGKTFSTALETDDITSDAINKINERQRKINKEDKEIDTLEKFGLTKAQAEYIGKEMFNQLLKANKEIEKLIGLNIERKVAEGMYAPVIKPIMDKLEGFKDKSTIKKEAIVIENRTCPECDFVFEGKATGNMLCEQCKTLVNIPKELKIVEDVKLITHQVTETSNLILKDKPFIELTQCDFLPTCDTPINEPQAKPNPFAKYKKV